MFQVVSFAGPTTFYIVDLFNDVEAALQFAKRLPVGDGVEVWKDEVVVWAASDQFKIEPSSWEDSWV